MPRTPDSAAGPLIEGEALVLESQASDPPAEDDYGLARTYKIWRNGELIKQAPNASEIWILLDEKQHRIVRQLVHDVVETSYYEVTYSGSNITKETWWVDVSKTVKIREISYTYSGSKVVTETQQQYNAAGVQIATLAYAYTYTGSKVTSVDTTYSEP